MELVQGFTFLNWTVVLLSAMFIGISKTGITGAGLIAVPLMAATFGGKESTGIILPMLITADIFAVWYYNRHAEWKYVLKLLPWALAGIIAGLITGDRISEEQFKTLISILVLAGISLIIWQDIKGKIKNVPDYWWFSAMLGLIGGFSTMIANAAGPALALYLLSMRLPKNVYIGTGAWFFFIINLTKVPLHVVFWETINWQTLSFDVIMIPAILLGVFTGINIVRIIPEKLFRIIVIATTAVTALLIIR